MAIDNIKCADKNIVSLSDDGVFKKPLHPVSAKGKPKNLTVLDEESYIQNLENIIERDFFPDLPKLKAQTEYLEALEKNDVVKLRELHHKYATRASALTNPSPGTSRTECNSPCTFETPLHKSSQLTSEMEKEPSSNEKRNNTDESNAKASKPVSLDDYLARSTSEDNASFEVIMEEAKKQHQRKYAWLYTDEKSFIDNQAKALALPTIEKQAIQEERPVQVDTWIYKNKNALMYVPDGVDLTEKELEDMKHKQREIIHGGTRYQKAPFNEQANRQAISEAAQIQARQKEGKIGIDGKELLPSESPKVNGYGFVKTPSPMPGVDDSPLMTWGEIEGTPFCLVGKNTPVAHPPGPTFRIPEVPARDKLALVLADKVRQRHRVKKQAALKAMQENLVSPHRQRSSTTEQLGTMSPAAQRLASSQLGIRTGLDKALLASYSPRSVSLVSPSSTPSSSVHSEMKSPRTPPLNMKRPENSLTDGLLHIPKRPRAKDFFLSRDN